MSKTITSPIAEFAGTVVIPSRLTLPQCMAWKASVNASSEYLSEIKENPEAFDMDKWDELLIPVLCQLIERFEIADFPEHPTPETFSTTPRRKANDFITWLGGEIRKVYTGEQEVPNA